MVFPFLYTVKMHNCCHVGFFRRWFYFLALPLFLYIEEKFETNLNFKNIFKDMGAVGGSVGYLKKGCAKIDF